MWHALVVVGGLWLFAAMSPGPNFVLAARTAARDKRRAGLATVAGIATATLVWGLAGTFGIQALFAAAPSTYLGLKLLGGAYLIWIGAKLLFQKPAPDTPASEAPTGRRPGIFFITGFMTNLANPKTAVFVSSLFASTLPRHAPFALDIAAAVLMSLVSAGWYALVVIGLSRPAAIRWFTRIRAGVDRLVGIVLAGFGLHLVLSTAR